MGIIVIIMVVWKNKRYRNKVNKNRSKCNKNNKIISKVKIIEHIYDNDII
jgi:hypothetical protein